MNQTSKAVHLGGRDLNGTCHACAFFNSRDEEYRVMLPFAKEGIERGEKAFHLVDPAHREERLRQLEEMRSAGVNGDERQIEVRPWEEAYLRNGSFDQNAMIALVKDILEDGKKAGFGPMRIWANMEWALTDAPGVEDIVEYESKLNYLLPKYDDVVVCTYDLSKFSAGAVMDILRTHPMVIIGEILQENPFYVPPDEFLKELHERKAPHANCAHTHEGKSLHATA